MDFLMIFSDLILLLLLGGMEIKMLCLPSFPLISYAAPNPIKGLCHNCLAKCAGLFLVADGRLGMPLLSGCLGTAFIREIVGNSSWFVGCERSAREAVSTGVPVIQTAERRQPGVPNMDDNKGDKRRRVARSLGTTVCMPTNAQRII
jgi:hypothetical protein